MNKKILAVAISVAVAAPITAFAGNNVIYGKMHAVYDFVDTNDAGGVDSSDDVAGQLRPSRIGFKGSEDLGDGMKAIFQIETQTGNSLGNRNTFVGLSGGFGTVVLGTHDTPYKISTGSLDLFGDTRADYNNIIGNYNGAVGFDERAGQTAAYITPTVSGLHAAIARVSLKAAEAAGAKETEAWSMTAIYKNGPIFATVAYEAYEDGSGSLGGFGVPDVNGESSAFKLGAGYKIGDGKIGFVYEDIDTEAANADRDAYMINYAHKFGANTFKIQYAAADDRDGLASSGAKNWTLGLDHAFSKRTKVYGLYTTTANDTNASYGLGNIAASGAGNDVNALSFGLVHTF